MWLGVWMHDYRLAVLTRCSRCAARGPDPLAGCAATAAREAMACASEEGAVGCRAASEAAWCHSGRREGMKGRRGARRGARHWRASCRSILGTTWSGAGYDNNGDAHYLFRPGNEMTGASRAACRPLCTIPCCRAVALPAPLAR
jgi:hypothetical protein